jgi:hypothetical protein
VRVSKYGPQPVAHPSRRRADGQIRAGNKFHAFDDSYDTLHGAHVASDSMFGFSSIANADGTADTALTHAAAGTVKVTDASTGLGTLIFKLPEVDPEIVGARSGTTAASSALARDNRAVAIRIHGTPL